MSPKPYSRVTPKNTLEIDDLGKGNVVPDRGPFAPNFTQTRLCQHRAGRPNTDSPITCFILCSVENDIELPVKDGYEGLYLLYISKLLTVSRDCEAS